jgi:hypothetical protein
MLQGQEHADITRAGVERAHKGNQQQRPEARARRKGKARGTHQRGGPQQQVPVMESMPPGANGQGGHRRPQQGGAGQHAHLPAAQAQRQQIGWQQDGDIAIGKSAHGAPHQQRQHGWGRTAWQEQAADHGISR